MKVIHVKPRNFSNLLLAILFGLLIFAPVHAKSDKSNKHEKSQKSQKSKKSTKINSAIIEALETRIDSLQTQIDTLSEGQNTGPIELFVDCVNGDTVNGALASVAEQANPLTITLSGVCNESVFISRDDVTLKGSTQSDGITGQFAVASQSGAARIVVENMTLVGGFAGLSCFTGSSIRGTNLIIENGGRGVLAFGQGSCVVDDSVIRNNRQGLTILDSSHALLRGSIVETNNVGANVWANASLSTDGTASNPSSIFRSNNIGVNLLDNGSFRPVNAIVEDNASIGINIGANSSIFVEFSSPSTVRNNPGIGINIGHLGSASFSTTLAVSGNGVGLACTGTFHVTNLGAATIDTVDASCL